MSPPARYADLIDRTAAAYGLDAGLLAAQIEVESAFDPFAFRHEPAFWRKYLQDNAEALGNLRGWGPLAACSYGLLQILGETALEIGYDDRPERLFDARVGLSWGAKYLARCLKISHGDPRIALQHYNGSGPASVAYAEKVFAAAGRV